MNSEQDASTSTVLARRTRLFEPGQPRLGWEHRDVTRFTTAFTEPQPSPTPVPEELTRRRDRAVVDHHDAFDTLKSWGSAGIVASILGVVLAMCASPVFLVITVGGFGISAYQGLRWHSRRSSKERAATAVADAERALSAEFHHQYAAWERRRASHPIAEAQRLSSMVNYGAVFLPGGSHRLDVFGGGVGEDWESFLTVLGASTLAIQPLTVIDLTQMTVCEELIELSRSAGMSVDAQRLSAHDAQELAGSDVLSGLRPRQLADVLVESIHGADATSARHERAADLDVLTTVIAALGEDVSLARIAAGLRVLLNEPDTERVLDSELRERIADELMNVDNREHARPSITRMIHHLRPIDKLGARSRPRDARLHCLILPDETQTPSSDLLAELLIQSAIHKSLGDRAGRSSIVVAGADRLHRRSLERLSDACAANDVHLTLLFRNLRDSALDVMGGGAVAFMRLGNHREAKQASDFVGNAHKFEVSGFSVTVGGSKTWGDTETTGHSVSDSVTVTDGTNWSTSSNEGQSTTYGNNPGSIGGAIFGDQHGTTSGTSTSEGGSHSVSKGRSKGRNWSTAHQYSEAVNNSRAENVQRVYEFVVEPAVFQAVGTGTLLLVEQSGSARWVRPVEFNPSLVTLPTTSNTPLPRDAPVIRQPVPQVTAEPIAQQYPQSTQAQPTHSRDPGYPAQQPVQQPTRQWYGGPR